MSQLIYRAGVLAGLDLFREDEDAEEDGSGGDSHDEDGAAEGLLLARRGTGGGVFAEAAALGAGRIRQRERKQCDCYA